LIASNLKKNTHSRKMFWVTSVTKRYQKISENRRFFDI
jgi:hypothetical protein